MLVTVAILVAGCGQNPEPKPTLAASAVPRAESVRGRQAQEADKVTVHHPAAGMRRPDKWKTAETVTSESIKDPTDSKPLAPESRERLGSNVTESAQLAFSSQSVEEVAQFYQDQSKQARVASKGAARTVTIPVSQGLLLVVASPGKDGQTLIVRQLLDPERSKEFAATMAKLAEGGAQR